MRVQCGRSDVQSLLTSSLQVEENFMNLKASPDTQLTLCSCVCSIVEQESHSISCHPLDGSPVRPKALKDFAEDISYATVLTHYVSSVRCCHSVIIICTFKRTTIAVAAVIYIDLLLLLSMSNIVPMISMAAYV